MKKSLRILAVLSIAASSFLFATPSQAATVGGVDVTVNVNAGSVIAQEGLVDVIRDSLLSDSLSAKFAAIYRQGGSFGS